MAQSDKINVFKKRKLLGDDDIYELGPEDLSPVESPIVITVEPSDEDLNELDVSQESSVTLDNLTTETVNFDKTVGPGAAPPGFILVDEDIAVDDDDNTRICDDTTTQKSEPIFKVMFRDADAARYVVYSFYT